MAEFQKKEFLWILLSNLFQFAFDQDLIYIHI